MQALSELGKNIALRRKVLGYRQSVVAKQAGISAETLSRLERGRIVEFGARKLLTLLAVLNLEMQFIERGFSGSLEELKKERETANT